MSPLVPRPRRRGLDPPLHREVRTVGGQARDFRRRATTARDPRYVQRHAGRYLRTKSRTLPSRLGGMTPRDLDILYGQIRALEQIAGGPTPESRELRRQIAQRLGAPLPNGELEGKALLHPAVRQVRQTARRQLDRVRRLERVGRDLDADRTANRLFRWAEQRAQTAERAGVRGPRDQSLYLRALADTERAARGTTGPHLRRLAERWNRVVTGGGSEAMAAPARPAY